MSCGGAGGGRAGVRRPPVEGLGTTGGFKIIIEDRGNLGLKELQRVGDRISEAARIKRRSLQGVFNGSRVDTPWLYLEIDRSQCMALGVQVSDVFNTLQYYLGSFYVNNFNEFGRTWQVNIQADQRFRGGVGDILELQVRNNQGQMVRLSTFMDVRDTSGPVAVLRYDLYSATAITGTPAPGTSSGQAANLMHSIVGQELPPSMASEWTELMYLQLQAGNTAYYAFGLAVAFVFLVLAAQYESWTSPLAIILVVPLCLLCSDRRRADGTDGGDDLHADRLRRAGGPGEQERDPGRRIRPAAAGNGIPLREASWRHATAFASDLDDVVRVHPRCAPAGDRQGAGAEMRRSLGVAVFSGMLG